MREPACNSGRVMSVTASFELCSLIGSSSWRVESSNTTGVLECIVIDGCRVNCYRGIHHNASTLLKVYSFDSTVTDAFWCHFDPPSSTEGEGERRGSNRCLCVREKGLLTCFMDNGRVLHCPLPFVVTGVWPLATGLLLQRSVEEEDGLAVLFSLPHPLDDLSPVAYRHSGGTAGSSVGYFTSPSEQVVAVHTAARTGPSFIVVYDTINRRHTIFQTKPALPEDVPSPLTTPRRRHALSLIGTPHPLSSSAPARCSHMSPCTPVKFSLVVESNMDPKIVSSGGRGHYTPDVLKPLALQRIKKETTPLRRISPRVTTPTTVINRSLQGDASVKSSGRSPYVDRYKTPATRPTWHKKAKSLSPQDHIARVSPFSQTVDSHSWSTFFTGMADPIDQSDLLPRVCLHSVWRETGVGELPNCPATSVYTCTDWSECQYIVLFFPSHNKLYYLSMRSGDGVCVVSHSCVACVDNVGGAVYLEGAGLMAVLTTQGQLELYNGPDKVCKVDISSLMSDHTPLSSSHAPLSHDIDSIRDNIDNSLTLVTRSGHVILCTIQATPITDPAVGLSVRALCSVFPGHTRKLLMSHAHLIFTSTDTSVQWALFCHWILQSVGIPVEEYHVIDSKGRVHPLLGNDPVYSLLNKLAGGCGQSGSSNVDPAYNVPLEIELVMSTLHLVYEEMKLNIHHHPHLYGMACLLFVISRRLNWRVYTDYYARDHAPLLNYLLTINNPNGSSDWTHSTTLHQTTPLYTTTRPPGIYKWLRDCLAGIKVEPFPMLSGVCQRSEKIVKVYSRLLMDANPSITSDSLYKSVTITTAAATPASCDMEISSFNELSDNGNLLDLILAKGEPSLDMASLPFGVSLPLQCVLLRKGTEPSMEYNRRELEAIGRGDWAMTIYSQKETSVALKIESYSEGYGHDYDGMDMEEEILRLKFPADARVREVKRLLQSVKAVRVALEQNPETSDHEFADQQKSRLLNICQRTMSLAVGRGMFTMATVHPLLFSAMKIPQLNLTGRAPPKNSSIVLDTSDYPADMKVWPEFHNGVATALKIGSDLDEIDSTWILFNQPASERGIHGYAGFLMGLGLNGHLASLNSFYLYEYLQQKHEVMVIGLLLGIATARCGSMSLSIASVLSVFLPPLLPLGSVDLETTVLMQTAAMLSLGILYMKSCNRFIAETFLKQIGHSPGPELEFAQNRECYSLAAGLALGMIALGKGGSLNDLPLVDQLCLYINGGSKDSLIIKASTNPSYLVLEANQINTHVTAPGAIVALGLMYLKTNDRTVAAHLAPPISSYQLDCVRPDLLMLRVLSYSLIMWDSVSPTHQWMNSLIPPVVRQYAFQQNTESPDTDYQTMCQAKVYITAGCCLALGFRYAGTQRQDVHQLLIAQYKEYFAKLQSPQTIELIGKTCGETCVCVILLALSMVMSGSGDLAVLRLVRQHHVRLTDCTYGQHMAVHMALGLLFLGGGRYCLSRSNKAIAALLCSLYPHFPSSASDNRYHLQALRHFYLLAAEPRVLLTRECDNGQACSVPVTLILENGEQQSLTTPCIIPEWDHITEIAIMDERYCSLSFDLKVESIKTSLLRHGTIFVKKHAGYSSYSADPKGQRSVLSLAVMSSKQFGTVEMLESTDERLFEEEWLNTYCAYLCCNESNKVYHNSLMDCISKDQLELLCYYLELEEAGTGRDSDCVMRLWNVKLCQAFCKFAKQHPSLVGVASTRLGGFGQLVDHTLLKIAIQLETQLKSDQKSALSRYVHGQESLDGIDVGVAKLLTMRLLDLPYEAKHINYKGERLLSMLHNNCVHPETAARTVLLL